MPAVWSISSSGGRPREVSIYRFLKDARCPVRVVEVRLFKKDPLFGRRPVFTRRWEPGSALAATAKEISKYIADKGSVDATIVASWDEV
jgi:hypothetical protein